MTGTRLPDRARRVVWQAASLCLGYPEQALIDRAALLRTALTESAPAASGHFEPLLTRWADTPLGTLQADYVQLFDLSRTHALHLSYWTDGDTRRRGAVLAEFKARYRASGWLGRLDGELPDHLPVVLEYAARVDPPDGLALLQQYRPSLELLRLSLLERPVPYAGVLTAVCGTLPGASPRDRAEVLAIARSGPPAESVGLDPYPGFAPPAAAAAGRLLPIVGGGR